MVVGPAQIPASLERSVVSRMRTRPRLRGYLVILLKIVNWLEKNAPWAFGRARVYPVLPLRDIVVFPDMIAPLFVGREKSIRTLEQAMKADKRVLLATQKNAEDDDPAPDAIYQAGTLASVLLFLELPDGTVKVLVEGLARARLKTYTRIEQFYEAQAEIIFEDGREKVEGLARSTASQFVIYCSRHDSFIDAASSLPTDPGRLADTVAAHLAVSVLEKQRILALSSVRRRLETCLSLMEREIMARSE